MESEYNIYCDESCHLEQDQFPFLILGGVWCKATDVKEIKQKAEGTKPRGRFLWQVT